MMYKTIVLELLQERPQIESQLRKERKLLPTLECFAKELKNRHKTWMDLLFQSSPGGEPRRIASEALELALRDLVEDFFPPVFPPDENETFSLEEAMTYLRRHSPPA